MTTIDFQIDSFDVRGGRLCLVSGPLTLHPFCWTFEQTETIRTLLADGLACIVYLAVADDGSATIANIEGRTFGPRVSAPGGSA